MLLEGRELTQAEIEESNKGFEFEENGRWIEVSHEHGYDYYIRNFVDNKGEKVLVLIDNFSVSPIVLSKIEGVTFASVKQGHIEQNLYDIYQSNLLDRVQNETFDYLASLKDYLTLEDFKEIVKFYNSNLYDISNHQGLKEYLEQ